MAKRVNAFKNAQQLTPSINRCDDCGHGNWVNSFNNIDWEGNPICLTCPNEKWHILRGCKACNNWKPKEVNI